MGRPKPRRSERNAGAFLGPDILVPASMRTLCDEYRDERAEPGEEREQEPEPPGLVRRVIERLTRRSGPGH
jgi:hypothetical protein